MPEDLPHQEQPETVELLEQPAFQRWSECFSVYQNSYNTEKDGQLKEKIRDRMRSLWKSTIENYYFELMGEEAQQLKIAVDGILNQCEQNQVGLQSIARSLRVGELDEYFLEKWQDDATDMVDLNLSYECDHFHVNRLLGYLDQGSLWELTLQPANIAPQQVLPELRAGLKKIAVAVQEEDVPPQVIRMVSWLLAKEFQPILKRIFPELEGKLIVGMSNAKRETKMSQWDALHKIIYSTS